MHRVRPWWIWAVLALVAMGGWAWATRYEYPNCLRLACLRVNRWTGAPAVVTPDSVHAYVARTPPLFLGYGTGTASPAADPLTGYTPDWRHRTPRP